MDYADRKRNRLNGHDYSDSGYYFITICTKDRIEILWNSGVGDAVPYKPTYTTICVNCKTLHK